MVIVQLVVPAYRRKLVEHLLQVTDRISFLTGTSYFSGTPRTDVASSNVKVQAKNYYLSRPALCWQTGVVLPAIKAHAAVVEQNPRIGSSWAIILGRLLLGKRTGGWGHWNSRGVETPISRSARWTMNRLVSPLILYTYRDAKCARASFPGKCVRIAPNSLYLRNEIYPASPDARGSSYVFIGRLVTAKKPYGTLRAFAQALPYLGDDVQLHIIGTGPLLESLQVEACELGVQTAVIFHGEINDVSVLRSVFAECCASIVSGYVGLSATQSLGFGTPVVYSRGEPNAPEADLLDSENSEEFRANDWEDLARAIVDVSRRDFKSSLLSRQIAKDYSIESMANPFLEMALLPVARGDAA